MIYWVVLASAGLCALILVLVRTVSIVFGHRELRIGLVLLLAERRWSVGDVPVVQAGRPAARCMHRVGLLHLGAAAGRVEKIRVRREQLQTGGHAGEGVSNGILFLIDVQAAASLTIERIQRRQSTGIADERFLLVQTV